MPPPLLGDPHIETVVRMACTKNGVTVLEVQDLFDVTYWGAYGFLRRLVRAGKLYKTERRRKRSEVIGDLGPGNSCKVYRATIGGRRWVNSLNLQVRRSSAAVLQSLMRKG